MNWSIAVTGISAASFIAIVRLIFIAGQLVDRLEQFERRVKTIEERHEHLDRHRRVNDNI